MSGCPVYLMNNRYCWTTLSQIIGCWSRSPCHPSRGKWGSFCSVCFRSHRFRFGQSSKRHPFIWMKGFAALSKHCYLSFLAESHNKKKPFVSFILLLRTTPQWSDRTPYTEPRIHLKLISNKKMWLLRRVVFFFFAHEHGHGLSRLKAFLSLLDLFEIGWWRGTNHLARDIFFSLAGISHNASPLQRHSIAVSPL